MKTKTTYIIDYFNIFSDYREVFYKSQGIDFHAVKHFNMEKDIIAFFEFFFSKYIEKIGISVQNSRFIFVMKKLYDQSEVMKKVLSDYKEIDIQLFVITHRYPDKLIEKSKDDFMCQYLLTIYPNSVLISTDNYTDASCYYDNFVLLENIKIQLMQFSTNGVLFLDTNFIINKGLVKQIKKHVIIRRRIQKQNLSSIITVPKKPLNPLNYFL